jgi:hypothetical protein
MGSRCYECAEINGYCSCPDRAIYNQQQLDQAIAAQRDMWAKCIEDIKYDKILGLDDTTIEYMKQSLIAIFKKGDGE